ncbi:MAG: hypothetical protein ACTSU7_11320 [Candidatus Heimdallarchaeaceae archaeon]
MTEKQIITKLSNKQLRKTCDLIDDLMVASTLPKQRAVYTALLITLVMEEENRANKIMEKTVKKFVQEEIREIDRILK